MLFKESPEKFWNLISSKYAASPIRDRTAYDKKIQRLKTYLSPESLVLDIGCGTGTQCCDIAADVKQVTGIDISDKLLAIAEQRLTERKLENVKFTCTSLFDEDLPAESVDMVMAFYVLHFFEDIDTVFSHIHSLLKPGGIFVFETACLGEKNKIAGLFLRLIGYLGFMPKIYLLTNEQLEQALDKTGFILVEKTMFSQSNAEYTFFAKKISKIETG